MMKIGTMISDDENRLNWTAVRKTHRCMYEQIYNLPNMDAIHLSVREGVNVWVCVCVREQLGDSLT